MSNLAIFLGTPIGALGFLFLVWRRMKEDYTSERIFSFGFILCGFLILGFLTGAFLRSKISGTVFFTPGGIWFWSSLVFVTFGFMYFVDKFKLRFFETLESVGIGLLFWLAVVFFIQIILAKSLAVFIFFLVLVGLIGLFYFLEGRYKRFVWYKSGKTGFSGLTVLMLFFIVRIVVALLSPNMLSFVGKIDAIFDVVSAFLFFGILFNLSGV